MKAVTVSVIMPAYQAERTIEEAIHSVQEQTFENWELIVVDDGSSDKTCELVRGILEEEPRIRLYANETNRGVAFSRNRGISVAGGVWIAFLDSDDCWISNKLEKQLEFAEEMKAQICYTASGFMDSDGRRYRYVMPAVQELSYRELLKRNLMSCSSVMVKRELIAGFPFTERPQTHEDYSAWLQIVKQTGFAYGLNKPLLIYRLSDHSKSAGRFQSALMNYHAYRCAGYGPLAGAAMTLRYAKWSIGKRRVLYRKGKV